MPADSSHSTQPSDEMRGAGALAPSGEGWQPIATAPKDGTEFLAWYPKHKLDGDDNMTDEVIGGAMAQTSFTGGSWNEPEWLGAHGSYFMEDWCFAEEPVLWHALPPEPVAADYERAARATSTK